MSAESNRASERASVLAVLTCSLSRPASASLAGVQTPLGDRIYGVKLKCGPRYPDVAPNLYFVNKIAMSGVDQSTGLVNFQVVTGRAWTRNTTMYEYLCKVREAMQGAAKTKQPNPDEQYPGN